jgi:hypothetical protein
VKGIEPSCPAWEAGVLPLNYTRLSMPRGSILLRRCHPDFQKIIPPVFVSHGNTRFGLSLPP